MISDFPRIMSEIRRLFLAIGILLLATRDGGAERINQEGRILGQAPVVATPTLFNTAEADAIVSAMQIMPVTNPWNEDISQRPRLANSDAMIAQIKSDLSPTRQNLCAFYEMNYVLVPDNQPRLSIPFLDYPDESDLDRGTFPNGNYPIPPNMPIESWPKGTGTLSLSQWQLESCCWQQETAGPSGLIRKDGFLVQFLRYQGRLYLIPRKPTPLFRRCKSCP